MKEEELARKIWLTTGRLVHDISEYRELSRYCVDYNFILEHQII